MRHCVAGYAQAVKAKRSFIFSICSKFGRSTLEICKGYNGSWLIAQHKSKFNSEPPKEHKMFELFAWAAVTKCMQNPDSGNLVNWFGLYNCVLISKKLCTQSYFRLKNNMQNWLKKMLKKLGTAKKNEFNRLPAVYVQIAADMEDIPF